MRGVAQPHEDPIGGAWSGDQPPDVRSEAEDGERGEQSGEGCGR